MLAALETQPAPETTARAKAAPAGPKPAPQARPLASWLRLQSINAMRHAAALRPFRKDEFGTTAASPSDAHIEAVNDLTKNLRDDILRMSRQVTEAFAMSERSPGSPSYTRLLHVKERMLNHVRLAEDIWKFYLELFGQRQSRFASELLACDRIALDCYQYVYTGLGRMKPVPSPAPFCYMETGFSPATFRRGVRIRKLGRLANPFPLIQLPYHRLVNPWTLGAVLHESAHNLQADLGLWQAVPLRVARRLLSAGIPSAVALIWARWHKETWADLCAVLLGGPAIVYSLMDVVARSAPSTLSFHPADVHPTPFLRVLINAELVKRMGFVEEAEQIRRMWSKLYPRADSGEIPRRMLDSFRMACGLVVDTMAFQPYEQLGGKSLAQAVRFEPKDQAMVEQAARRIAAGRDPGIIPALFLVGAARVAADRALARPETIWRNFYRALVRR